MSGVHKEKTMVVLNMTACSVPHQVILLGAAQSLYPALEDVPFCLIWSS